MRKPKTLTVNFTVTSSDPEIQAIEIVASIVGHLKPSEAARVMKYVQDRYGAQWVPARSQEI